MVYACLSKHKPFRRQSNMVGNRSKLEKEQAYREAFLGRLSRKLGVPNHEWTTVRCWTDQSLNRICRQIRDELAEEGMEANLTHRSLLDWITRLGLMHSLPVEGESFYLLEIGAGSEAELDPFELLMASKPLGVVCYFSAVAFHSLTTQPVEHHHVAELRAPGRIPPNENVEREDPGRPGETTASRKRASPGFGTLLFRHQGV